jgi:carboxypeptidase Taq
MSALSDLLAHQRQTAALAQVMERLGWDQETVMPAGAAEQRGEEMACARGRAARPAVRPLGRRDAGAGGACDRGGGRAAPRIARSHARATKVPADLAAELARVTSVAQGIWADARGGRLRSVPPDAGDRGAPASGRGGGAGDGGDLYDALIDDYEPGMTAAELAAMFGRMRPRLVELRARILEAGPTRARG